MSDKDCFNCGKEKETKYSEKDKEWFCEDCFEMEK